MVSWVAGVSVQQQAVGIAAGIRIGGSFQIEFFEFE
jgi:hypothetical protein